MNPEIYPLSFPQQAIFLDSILNGPTTKFNMGGGIVIRGALDAGLFRQGIEFAFRQHDALRMRIRVRDGEPWQEFVEDVACPFEWMDFSGYSDPFEAAVEWLLADIHRPMKEDQYPLSGDVLFRLGQALHLWYPKFHHIANDGFGHALVAETVAAAYNSLLYHGRLPERERYSYADFVREDRAYAGSARFGEDAAFWQRKFASMPAALPFTARRRALTGDMARTDQCTLGLHRLVYNALLKLCEEAGVTPFQFLLAVLFTCLNRMTGRDDIVIGTPILNRSKHAFRRTAGMFMNMMPLRIAASPDTTVLQLARQIASDVRTCYRRQRFPLAEILRHCRTVDGFCHGVYDVTMVYRKLDYDLQFGGSPARTVTLDPQARDESLSVEVDEYNAEEDVNIFFNFNPRLISRETAGQMAKAFERLLIEIAVAGDRKIGETPDASIHGSPGRAIAGEALAGPGRPLADWIGDHARRHPGRTALISGGIETSYVQLHGLVALRRGQFGALGLQAGSVLAVACAPGVEWTAAVLAGLAEGITVLPLDPKAPAARLSYMLKDSAAVLLWHDASFRVLERLACPTLDSAVAPLAPPKTGAARACLDSTAYILYTSGTTGRPKGVRVSQRAFEMHCRSAIAAYGLTEDDRTLVFAPAHFDASWEQLFAPLVAGGSVLIRDADIWAPEECSRRLADAHVTCADLPPQYLRELLYFLDRRPEAAPRCLRLVICGGEALPSSLAEAWLAGALGDVPLVNAYGPTEGVVTSAFHRIAKGSRVVTQSGAAPIGRPMPGRILHILDERGKESGRGMPGELCIGSCLADGYHGDEARTGDAFRYWLQTPQGGCWADAQTPGAVRLYRTGDRVQMGEDNLIEFLGRADRQIKIRGFRIEPAEIESVLARHPAIAQAVVVGVERQAAGGQLAAYCVSKGTGTPSRSELAGWMSRWLPDFMIPASILFLPKFPTTASGKIDTAALPQPEIEPTSQPVRSELEARIAAIWADALGRPEVGLDENFFDIGGHSLLLVRVHTRLASELGATVRLVDLFANPTVARTAQLLRGYVAARAAGGRRTRREDVAVIGMSGRFPGAATVDELWDDLAAGKERIRFFSDAELAAAGVPAEVRRRPDYVPAHGYVEGVRLFDAAFFGYTPKEAEVLDPQQRFFLEEAWHALENAGYDPGRYAGDIAVFGGMGMSHYLLDNLSPRLRQDRAAEGYAIILANDKDFITTRVSYKLGLRGPSVNVNTACSTSLVAIHIAAEALLRGECDMALAGGVTLHVGSAAGHVYQPGGIASPDGHCRAFAEDAAGTVGASGVAVVVLKRLDQALADGDTIRAVIKGSAINNDGADKVGFTAPGVNRQRDAIRAALDGAGLSAASIQYVEAHGTGTPMGDPIEIQALTEAYAPDRPEPQSCFIGSIKSNLGHLDTAAGVAGFIKTVLALEHGQIPPTLHCERPSSRIGFEHTPFRVAQTLTPWPANGRRRAGVSSFGMGGANAHVVLEEAPSTAASLAPRQDVWCIPISARSTTSLLAFAEGLARHLEAHPALDATDLWFTLSEGRRRFRARAVVLAASRLEAIAALRALGPEDLVLADRDGKVVSGNRSFGRAEAGGPELAGARDFARVWLTGEESEAGRLLPAGPHRRIPLPGYIFEREEYWIEPPKNRAYAPARLPVSEWFHFPAWEPLPARRARYSCADPVLVVHGGSAVEMRWMEALAGAGIQFTASRGGKGLEESLARAGGAFVCWHIGALGLAPGGPAEYARNLDSLLGDIRTLAAARRGQTNKLLLLGPQSDGPGAGPAPAYAYLDAACAAIAHEYRSIAAKVLHVDPAVSVPAYLRTIASAAALPDQERSLAVWDGRLWRRTLSKLEAGSPEQACARLVQRGVYLITGGLGAIGLTLAGRLAHSVQARLALVSRSEPDPAQRAAIRALEAGGAQVRTAALDVADAAALRALVDDICAQWGRIDGVIHSAGAPGGSLIRETRLEEIERVLRPKVAGAESLAAALEGRDPSFVVLCSSLAASAGGAGQVVHLAANAWMDAYAAAQSRMRPGVWTSVQWDRWAAGSAEGPPFGMTREEGMEVFLRALDVAEPVVSISTVGWRHAATLPPAPAEPQSTGRPRPESATAYREPRTEAEKLMAGVWQEVLGYRRIGLDDDLVDLGADSLTALQASTRLEELTGQGLPLGDFFGAATIATLASALASRSVPVPAGGAPEKWEEGEL